MMSESTVVYVVDDDPSIRKSMRRLIGSIGYGVETFERADDFLDLEYTNDASCLVLDMQMPGLSGLELQDRLREIRETMPIIFVTGHASVASTVHAMKAGAVELLEKPFDDKALIDAIHSSIEKSKAKTKECRELEELRRREKRLTPREREVFELVVTGLLNKQIARDLKISEKTVKVHRGRVMEKMEVRTLARLVHLAEKLGIPHLEAYSPLD